MTLAGNLSFAAVVFFSMVILVALIRSFFYRNKPIAASGTWDAVTQPTVKMQYTGRPMHLYPGFFPACGPLSEEHPAIQAGFLQKPL